jgi:anti-anti-sigma factor
MSQDDRRLRMTDAGRVRPPGFELATDFSGPVCTIRLTGELDAAVIGQLKEALAEAERRKSEKVVFDVGELVFIDSTGIQTLIGAERAVDGTGHAVVVARPTGDVKRIFDLVALDKLVTIVDD